jgi:dihydroorotase
VNRIETPLWRDGHLHLRQKPQIDAIGPISARWCSDVVVMPNTSPPVTTADGVKSYRRDCRAALGSCNPVMTLYLTPDTTPEMIIEAKAAGCGAVKVYPCEQTTNSQYGIPRELYDDPEPLYRVLTAIADSHMPLLWHGELPGEEIMDQEAMFCPVFERVARDVPRLRMVFEHVSSLEGVEIVKKLYSQGYYVAATISLHHLWLKNGLTDVMRPKCKPDWVCMPIAKRRKDHAALISVISHPAFFLGTDSAPHLSEAKYCSEICAGCFTSPHPEMLLDIFEEHGLFGHLVAFTSRRMGDFYWLGEPVGQLKFVRNSHKVPDLVEGYVPFLAGRELKWRLDI